MRQFLVILGLTALVWLGVSMSEPTEYPVDVKVTFSGYDSVRYAVVYADTAVTLRVTSSGFVAIGQSLKHRKAQLTLTPEGNGSRRALAMKQVCLAFTKSRVGITQAVGSADSLRLVLAPRESRTFRPTLENVEFSFAEQYGLYGEPVIVPAEVTLYGPREALDKIDHLPVAETHLANIHSSGHHRLALEPVWDKVGDIRPSQAEVDIYLPVEAYVEHEYEVPIEVLNADTSVQLKLYPQEVTLRVWIAQRDLHRSPDFRVGIDYNDILVHGKHITPRLMQFPDYIRPRCIEPEEVQCVIIK